VVREVGVGDRKKIRKLQNNEDQTGRQGRNTKGVNMSQRSKMF
jgi:hypothetical protein